KFEEAPLGRRPIQVCHALADQLRGAWRNKKKEPLDEELSCRRFAAHIEPENSEGQSRIDGTLRLGSIHAEQRKGCLPLPQQATRVNRTKRSLQINTGGQAGDGESGKVSFARPFQP